MGNENLKRGEIFSQDESIDEIKNHIIYVDVTFNIFPL